MCTENTRTMKCRIPRVYWCHVALQVVSAELWAVWPGSAAIPPVFSGTYTARPSLDPEKVSSAASGCPLLQSAPSAMHDAFSEPQNLSPLLMQHFQVVNLWTQDRAKSDIWSVPEFEQYLAAETGGPASFNDFWDQVQRVTSEALHAAWAFAAEGLASNCTQRPL